MRRDETRFEAGRVRAVRACSAVLIIALAGCQGMNSMTQLEPTADAFSDRYLPNGQERRGVDFDFETGDAQVATRSSREHERRGVDFDFVVPDDTPQGRSGAHQKNVAENLSRAHREAAMGHDELAETYYRRVLTLDPRHAEAHHCLGVLADRKGKYTVAQGHYQAALRENRNDADVWNDLGYSYLLQNRFDESRRALDEAARINPHHRRAAHNLATLYARTGDYEQSLAALTRAVGETRARLEIAQLFPHQPPADEPSGPVVASFQPHAPGDHDHVVAAMATEHAEENEDRPAPSAGKPAAESAGAFPGNRFEPERHEETSKSLAAPAPRPRRRLADLARNVSNAPPSKAAPENSETRGKAERIVAESIATVSNEVTPIGDASGVGPSEVEHAGGHVAARRTAELEPSQEVIRVTAERPASRQNRRSDQGRNTANAGMTIKPLPRRVPPRSQLFLPDDEDFGPAESDPPQWPYAPAEPGTPAVDSFDGPVIQPRAKS